MASSQSLLEMIPVWGWGVSGAGTLNLSWTSPGQGLRGWGAAELPRQQLPLPMGASPAWSEECGAAQSPILGEGPGFLRVACDWTNTLTSRSLSFLILKMGRS